MLAQVHQVPADWIMLGNGCAELLTWACRDLAHLPVTHLLTPAFGDYQRALNAFGATVQPYPLDVDGWQPICTPTHPNSRPRLIPLPQSLFQSASPSATGCY